MADSDDDTDGMADSDSDDDDWLFVCLFGLLLRMHGCIDKVKCLAIIRVQHLLARRDG